MMTVFWHTMKDRVLDFIFPMECLSCGKGGEYCCLECLNDIPVASTGKRRRMRVLDNVFCAYPFADMRVRRLISDFKYHGYRSAGDALEVLVQKWMLKHGDVLREAVFVPVPLHISRERARGFNQALRIAEMMATVYGNEVDAGLLRRIRATKPQSSRGVNRKSNVADAFTVMRQPDPGQKYLIIDDIWTSGATVTACAKVLRKAGVQHVSAFAFAKA